MSGIICCVCSISTISVLQCALNNGETISTRFRRERVTATSRPMMNLNARAPSHVSFSSSASPGMRSYGSQDPWSSIAQNEERSGRPDIGIDRMRASDYNYHEQFMESFSSASYSKWDDDRAWSSQEWKLILRCTSDRGDPMKLLGERHEKFDQVSLTRKPFMMEPRKPL